MVEAFVKGLRNEYEDPVDGVGWDGREGGDQWNPQWDTHELVHEFYDDFASEELLEAVCAAMPDITWVEEDFVTRRRDDVLIEAWDRFCEAVKHKTPFVIWLLRPEEDDLYPGEVSPAKILEHITWLVESLNLVRILPAGNHRNPPSEHFMPTVMVAPLGSIDRLTVVSRVVSRRWDRGPSGWRRCAN